MIHEELLKIIDTQNFCGEDQFAAALRAVVELHTGTLNNRCVSCLHGNKCETIQAIEKELA